MPPPERVLPPSSRSLASLHADLWRSARAAPGLVLGLPVLVGLPGLLLDALGPADLAGYLVAPGWFMAQLVVGVAGWLAWCWASAAIQLGLLGAGRSGAVDARAALRDAAHRYDAVLAVSLASGVLILAGLLALVVPGVLLLLRLWFVVPVVLTTELTTWNALKAAGGVYAQRPWRVQGVLTVVGVVYGLPALLLPYLVENRWLHLLASLPQQAGYGLLAAVTLLLHAELTGMELDAPVGVRGGRAGGAGALLVLSLLSAGFTTWAGGHLVRKALGGVTSAWPGGAR
ncbi:MAG: hypothetical protein HY904_08600 [Deltaproteobacteria bacterium]|nr:hypothetical protein [Deltaproteobacteria bacterium]